MTSEDSGMSEIKWEGRLWTFFQIGMVALVGYLTMQAIDTQRLLAQMVTEHRYTNVRLDKIEVQIERGVDDRYRATEARRDFDAVARSIAAIETRMRVIESHDQQMANEIFDLQRRLGVQNKSRSDP